MGDPMGRFQERVKTLVLRMRRAWSRYAEFIEGKELEHALRFESERMKPTWIMRSDIEAELAQTAGVLDFKTLSRFYPYGFEFRRHFVRERRRDEPTSELKIEIELTAVFSHGEVFRPESRCRIEPELLPRPREASSSTATEEYDSAGRVLVMKELREWLGEVGFSDFHGPELYPDAKALMIDLGSRGAWVVIDPRPEVFSRPLAEALAQIVAEVSRRSAKKSARWTELVP